MDHVTAQRWLDDYVAAWISCDPGDIGALFNDEVVYRYHPHDEPVVGKVAVVASWLGDGADGGSSPDEPGTFEAQYHPVAIDGEVVVARGVSSYRDTPYGPVVRVYDNCFLMRFDGAGRCADFTEFYTLRPTTAE